jgi:proline iminopeptidase
MRNLYDPIEPYATGKLRVSDLHELYYEQCGNPDGQPVVFLHGGPGAGLIPDYRRFFDPDAYRIVLFDQRGSGQSSPHACLEDNTTWHLVEDIERLRTELGVQRWLVFGGSWGSTLSLAYAETHPERVRGLVLRGIFLCRQREISWFYQEGTGAGAIFPDVWEQFLNLIPEAERADMLSAYHRRLTSDDQAIRLQAARVWSIWEASALKLLPDQDLVDQFSEPQLALSLARIECHYSITALRRMFDRKCWQDSRHPAAIVQGRYDIVCPMMSAWELHRRAGSRVQVIPDAGHWLANRASPAPD